MAKSLKRPQSTHHIHEESCNHIDQETGFIFNDTKYLYLTKQDRRKEDLQSNKEQRETMAKYKVPDKDKSIPRSVNAEVIDLDLASDEDGWKTISDPNGIEKDKKKPQVSTQRKEPINANTANNTNNTRDNTSSSNLGTEVFELDNDPPMIARSALDREALAMKEKRALPPIIGASITFDELNGWLALLDTAEKKERIMIYVYRTLPVCNRQMTDPENPLNIDVMKGGVININEFINYHGGGKYKFIVNDLERNRVSKTSNGTIYTVYHEIPFAAHMPNIRWEELDLQHKNNKGFITYCQGKGILDGQGRFIDNHTNPLANARASNQPNSQSNREGANDVTSKLLDAVLRQNASVENRGRVGIDESVTNSAIKIVADTSARQMEVLVANMKGNQGSDRDVLTGVAALIGPLLASRTDPNALSTKDIMLMMQAQNEQTMKIMMLMIENNKPKDTGNKIDDLRNIIAIAKEITGGPSAPSSWVDKLVDVASENAGPLLGVIGNYMSMSQQANARTQNPNVPIDQGFQPIQPITHQLPNQTIPTQAQPINNGIPGNGAQSDMNLDPELIQLKMVINAQGQVILNALAQGLTGDVFADSLIALHSRPTYMMISKCGPVKILKAMSEVPEFWRLSQGTYGDAVIQKFVEDFVNHDAIVAAEENGGMDDDEDNDQLIREKSQETKVVNIVKSGEGA